MPILYETYAFPETPTPKVQRAHKYSPEPWDWTSFAVGGAIGLFIGLPIGREILKAGMRLTEREIRERIEKVGK